jgi:hypothetical protein
MTRYIPPNDADFLAWVNNFFTSVARVLLPSLP